MHPRTSRPLFLMLLAAGCSAPRFAIEPSLGRLDGRGDIAVTEPGQPLVRNSFDDMGLSGKESSFGVRGDFKWGVPHLTLATQSAEWSGSGTVSDFGAVIGNDVAVDSRAELGVHRALLTFDVLPGGMFELGLGLGVNAIDIDGSATDSNTSRREEFDELIPIPVLALRLGLAVWRLEFEALVAGMGIEVDGDKAVYLDLDLAARFALIQTLPFDALLSVGYRRIDLDLEYEDDGDSGEVDLIVDGLYLGLRLAF